MTDIVVPVSAPGADTAAKSIDDVADASKRAADNAAYLAKVHKEAGDAAKLLAAKESELRFGVFAATKELNDQQKVLRERHIPALTAARREAASFNKEMGAQEHEMLSKRATNRLARMIPGGEIADSISNIAEGAGSARLGVAFGGLAAVAIAAGFAIEANSKRIEEQNKSAQELIKANQEWAKTIRETSEKTADTALSDFRSIKNSVRTILHMDPNGAQLVGQLQNTGEGSDVINAMASFMKNRGKRYGSGAFAKSGSEILDIAKNVGGETGLSITDVLKEMEKSKGTYNHDRLIKQITGGGAYSPELMKMFGEMNSDSDISRTVSEDDRVQRRGNRARTGRALNGGLVSEAGNRELQNILDPMVKIMEEHNRKLQEEIEIRSQVMFAERSMIDWWLDASPQLTVIAGKLGITSASAKAVKSVEKLSKDLR